MKPSSKEIPTQMSCLNTKPVFLKQPRKICYLNFNTSLSMKQSIEDPVTVLISWFIFISTQTKKGRIKPLLQKKLMSTWYIFKLVEVRHKYMCGKKTQKRSHRRLYSLLLLEIVIELSSYNHMNSCLTLRFVD